jgi:hypothetical protein
VYRVEDFKYTKQVLDYRPAGRRKAWTTFKETTRRRYSSVGMALGYGLDDRDSRVRLPAGAGNFSIHHRVQNGFGAQPASYPIVIRGSFPGGKVAGGVKMITHLHLVPTSKNECSYTSTPPTRLHGVVLS